ncbi:MAG: hypothetical protein GY822_03605 [Deltaproteobacteria bacterium]|nr:hypothetical protein [Deltaproteobacteria bacterium]
MSRHEALDGGPSKKILERMGANFVEDGTASMSLADFALQSVFGNPLNEEAAVSIFSDEAFAFTAPSELVAVGPLWVAGLESPKQLMATTRDAHARLQKRLKDDLALLADAGAAPELQAPHIEARAVFQFGKMRALVALDANRSLFLREVNRQPVPITDALVMKNAEKASRVTLYLETQPLAERILVEQQSVSASKPEDGAVLNELDMEDLLDSDKADSSEDVACEDDACEDDACENDACEDDACENDACEDDACEDDACEDDACEDDACEDDACEEQYGGTDSSEELELDLDEVDGTLSSSKEAEPDPVAHSPKVTKLEIQVPALDDDFEDDPTRAQADIAIERNVDFSGAAARSIPSEGDDDDDQEETSAEKNEVPGVDASNDPGNPLARLASVVGEGISSGKTGAFALDAEAFALLRGETPSDAQALVVDDDEIRTILAEAEELETRAKQLRSLAEELKKSRSAFAVKPKNTPSESAKPTKEKKRKLADRLKEQRAQRDSKQDDDDVEKPSHAELETKPKAGEKKNIEKKSSTKKKKRAAIVEVEENGATIMAELNLSIDDDNMPDGDADAFAETPSPIYSVALVVQDARARDRLAKKLKAEFEKLVPISDARDLVTHPELADFTAVVFVRPSKNKASKEALQALEQLPQRPKVLVVSPESAWQKHKVVDKRVELARRAPEVAASVVEGLRDLGVLKK